MIKYICFSFLFFCSHLILFVFVGAGLLNTLEHEWRLQILVSKYIFYGSCKNRQNMMKSKSRHFSKKNYPNKTRRINGNMHACDFLFFTHITFITKCWMVFCFVFSSFFLFSFAFNEYIHFGGGWCLCLCTTRLEPWYWQFGVIYTNFGFCIEQRFFSTGAMSTVFSRQLTLTSYHHLDSWFAFFSFFFFATVCVCDKAALYHQNQIPKANKMNLENWSAHKHKHQIWNSRQKKEEDAEKKFGEKR